MLERADQPPAQPVEAVQLFDGILGEGGIQAVGIALPVPCPAGAVYPPHEHIVFQLGYRMRGEARQTGFHQPQQKLGVKAFGAAQRT